MGFIVAGTLGGFPGPPAVRVVGLRPPTLDAVHGAVGEAVRLGALDEVSLGALRMGSLSKKNVVLGVTGGIAAYKAAELCRLFVKAGARVRVVMTDAAKRFIGPLTMATLPGAPVADDLFAPEAPAAEDGDGHGNARGIGHIQLGDEADVIVVAPATADSIARLAAGRADDLLSAVVLASRAPVLLAPAMNVNMWGNPLPQQNLGKLVALGRFRTVGPDAGDLACGWGGQGRLIEPSEILAATERLLTPQA